MIDDFIYPRGEPDATTPRRVRAAWAENTRLPKPGRYLDYEDQDEDHTEIELATYYDVCFAAYYLLKYGGPDRHVNAAEVARLETAFRILEAYVDYHAKTI